MGGLSKSFICVESVIYSVIAARMPWLRHAKTLEGMDMLRIMGRKTGLEGCFCDEKTLPRHARSRYTSPYATCVTISGGRVDVPPDSPLP